MKAARNSRSSPQLNLRSITCASGGLARFRCPIARLRAPFIRIQAICRARTGRTAPDLGVHLQTDTGLSADCVRTGEVLLCHDAESNPRVDLASSRRLGVRSILVAPLRHFRRTLGVFEVLSSAPYAFDHNDVATMQFLSGMIVAAIARLPTLQPAPQPASMAGD